MGVTSLRGCVVSLLSDLGMRNMGRRIMPPTAFEAVYRHLGRGRD